MNARMVSLIGSSAVLAAVVVVSLADVRAEDDPPFRAGTSTRTWNGRTYDIVVPEDESAAGRRGLVVVVASGGGYPSEDSSRQASQRNWERVAPDGWIVCFPKSTQWRAPDDNWSSNEASEIGGLARHVAARLDVPPTGIHLFAWGDVSGFAALVAFDKDAPWRSVCFDRCKYRGGSLPKRLRDVGAMVAWDESGSPPDGHDKLVEALGEKARSVDLLSTDHVTGDPVFRWWLDAMDGRFEPGRDHSLPWAAPPADVEALRAALADGRRGGLVWFHAPEDAQSDAARELQLDVLFDAAVREHGRRVLTFRAPLASAQGLAAALDVTSTPAVVVLDAKGKVKARFEGQVHAKDLAKALKAVRGR